MRTINKIAEIADIVDDSTTPPSLYPAAQLLNKGYDIHFSPVTVAAYMLSLFSTFDSNVPDDMKEEFKSKTKEYFDKMYADREQYNIVTDDKISE
jgi:hypothetical protein